MSSKLLVSRASGSHRRQIYSCLSGLGRIIDFFLTLPISTRIIFSRKFQPFLSASVFHSRELRPEGPWGEAGYRELSCFLPRAGKLQFGLSSHWRKSHRGRPPLQRSMILQGHLLGWIGLFSIKSPLLPHTPHHILQDVL